MTKGLAFVLRMTREGGCVFGVLCRQWLLLFSCTLLLTLLIFSSFFSLLQSIVCRRCSREAVGQFLSLTEILTGCRLPGGEGDPRSRWCVGGSRRCSAAEATTAAAAAATTEATETEDGAAAEVGDELAESEAEAVWLEDVEAADRPVPVP